MVKRILMIAFHFPPLRGSSGIQRTLKFAQYLPQCGWLPVVLSAHRRAYRNSGDDQMRDIPPEVVVHRAFALDTSHHLSFKGRYLGWLAVPDRWVTWLLGAVPAGLRLVRKYRPEVIWSTYPIASAHLIGLLLHRLTGIPWVADLRDPMIDAGHPSNPVTRRAHRWIEAQTLKYCSRAVCTTPGAIRTYLANYPDIPASRFSLLENGFDEENFADAEGIVATSTRNERFVLVHSGVVYPSERDPVPLFEALAALKAQGKIDAESFQLILRATGHDNYIADLVKQAGIADLVTLAPHVSYREALSEMLTAGGLLVLQSRNSNHQIPAKLYEYLRARRPVLALTDADGDTAAALRNAGIDTIAPLDTKDAIMEAMQRFLALAKAGAAPLASTETINANSRRARADVLARLLDVVASEARFDNTRDANSRATRREERK